MPPELWHVLDACPTQRTWANPKRPHEPNLAGARDRAMLLVGFVGALRVSELAGLTLETLREHRTGW